MNILVAPDKFKGSLTAFEVCQIVKAGLAKNYPTAEINLNPMADGGDGSLVILAQHLALEKKVCEATDPLGRKITAPYYTAGPIAFIELASTSGLVLLNKTDRNPLLTSTVGTGLQIKHAITHGAKEIILFLGGSATNDAGLGIAKALGFQFQDKEKNSLAPIGAKLIRVNQIIPSAFLQQRQINFTLLSDVRSPMYGPFGAAFVFAAQKGASTNDIKTLDQGLEHLSQIFIERLGKNVRQVPGGGAAGAIAAGLSALLNATIKNGFDYFADLTQLEMKIQQADVVITGEGKLDEQSLNGKVIDGISKFCVKHKKPLIVLTGKNELSREAQKEHHIQQIYTLESLAQNSTDSIQQAARYLKQLTEQISL